MQINNNSKITSVSVLAPTSVVNDAVVQNPLHVSQERFGRAVHLLFDVLNRNGKEIVKHLQCNANIVVVQDEILKASCSPFLMYRDPWDGKYTLRNQDAAQDTLASEMVLSGDSEQERNQTEAEKERQSKIFQFLNDIYISSCGTNYVFTISSLCRKHYCIYVQL